MHTAFSALSLASALILVMTTSARADEQLKDMPAPIAEGCKLAVNNIAVVAEICPAPKKTQLVRITIPRPQKAGSDLVVEAIFPSGPVRPSGQFWQRIEATGGDGIITQAEQQNLRFAVVSIGPDRIDANARSVIDFLANFIEPGTHLEPFERAAHPRLLGQSNNGFTLICDFIGKEKEATFSAFGIFTTALTPIGQEETRCRGRCGISCDQPFQWRKNQYTQECLNHDVCRDKTGQQFGECEDEFWAAAEGYLSAPDCPFSLPHPFVPGELPLILP